jgi:hypothetical protein
MDLRNVVKRMEINYYDSEDYNYEGSWESRVQHVADSYLVDWPYECLADDGIHVEPHVLDAIRWMIAAGMVAAFDGGVKMVEELSIPPDDDAFLGQPVNLADLPGVPKHSPEHIREVIEGVKARAGSRTASADGGYVGEAKSIGGADLRASPAKAT